MIISLWHLLFLLLIEVKTPSLRFDISFYRGTTGLGPVLPSVIVSAYLDIYSDIYGACLVKDGIVISTGYNGMPWGCSDDILPWDNTSENEADNKRPYVCHAEYNAFVNKGAKDLTGSTLYTGLFPCMDCAKLIIQTGIREVVYMSNKHQGKTKYKIAADILSKAEVITRQFIPEDKVLTLHVYEPASHNPIISSN